MKTHISIVVGVSVYLLLCNVCRALELATATSSVPIKRLCPHLGYEPVLPEPIAPSDTNDIPQTILCRCEIATITSFALKIDCQENEFNNIRFEAELLPVFTETLDMSWNRFEYIPEFVGEDLRSLDMSHNRITTVDDHNFAKLRNLRQLNLSYNQIKALSIDAFTGLTQLVKLDLSRNELRRITINVFSPLTRLMHLNLSRNRYLNDTFSRGDMDLFLALGVTPNLRTLEIEESDLIYLDISGGVHLETIHLKFNEFVQIPDIPRGIVHLDFSGNPLRTLTAKCLPHLTELQALYMTDMPNLTTVDEYALFGLPSLRIVSFEGSWNLNDFDSAAFGANDVLNDTDTKLEELNLRGTNFKSINESVVFDKLTVLDLAGTPMVCDCGVKWIVELDLETNAECMTPPELRGRKVSQVTVDQLKCKRFPPWVYQMLNGLLVLLLLVMCGVATWLIVTGIRPSRRNQLQKVGATSPYARVTIEPNRAEDFVQLR